MGQTRTTETLTKRISSVNSRAKKSLSSETKFDFIVIGVGSMGSGACYFLAKQGYKVLGIDQFDITHENGSHTGQSRIIRQAYFEHPDYVPLLKRAYENWQSLEKEANVKLIHKTGLLYFGDPESGLVADTRKSAKQYDLKLDELSQDQVKSDYPQFSVPNTFHSLYEPNAGFVTPEWAILTYTNQALSYGAEIHTNENVISWNDVGSSVKVVTDEGAYTSDKIIITAGAYTGKLIPELDNKLTVTRQVIAWVETRNNDLFGLDKLPCWTLADEGFPGIFYGFPILPTAQFGPPLGFKLAYHYPGIEAQPNNLDREIKDSDKKILVDMMEKYIPDGYDSFSEIKTCMYTNTADAHFIIDFLSDNEKVIIASGFSGHGFKFSSVVGEILSDLAVNGKTSQPIEFLNLGRLE